MGLSELELKLLSQINITHRFPVALSFNFKMIQLMIHGLCC